MTESEKARAYDEALEGAKKLLATSVAYDRFTIEKIFPELKESKDEDERIRKGLIKVVSGTMKGITLFDTDVTREEALAWLEKQVSPDVVADAYLRGCNDTEGKWLEKQGESTLIEEIKRRKELYSREKEKAVLFAEKLSLGGRIAVLEELLVFANEKQGEQKPILDFKASNFYVSKVDGKIHDITYNSTDKVEPKFKFGDWIVNNNSKDVFLIKSTNSGYCTLESIKGNIISPCLPPCESESHIWTIQDAKDGDVLHSPTHHLIWIYKDDKHYYVCINLNYTSNNISVDGSISIPNDVCPATKEQRDTLEKAMADAGYTFNFDKKSLKKIYQKPAWSEEDEEIIEALNDYVKNLDIFFSEIKIGDKDIVSREFREKVQHWLKSLKNRVQPKQEWSDEDEKMLNFCIKHYADGNCITWLESLKTRLGGK